MTTALWPDNQSFQIGDVVVHKIVDCIEPTNPRFLYCDKQKEDFNPYLDWLQPHFLDEGKRMLLSIHAFVIVTDHHTVLVDTCVGNQKQALAFSNWNGRQDSSFLDGLSARGLSPECIDYVLCTHMHLDHTGWNTRLVNGCWQPTFPNAKYLFSPKEWKHWETADGPGDRAVVTQNIEPIFTAGQVEWVTGRWGIGDTVTLLPTPGHTPGHYSVQIKSKGDTGLITGDVIVNPVQIAEPSWNQIADEDKSLAVKTRTQLIDRYCDTNTLILGTHFHTPTGVYIVGGRMGKSIRW